jgi:hypothetical protein
VPQALDEMENLLLVVRLELAAAAAGAEGAAAVVRVIPVGHDGTQWAAQLLAMYRAWADRTARDATTVADDALALRIDGLATLDLLAGETGLHRHVRPDRTEALARVIVEAPDTRRPAMTPVRSSGSTRRGSAASSATREPACARATSRLFSTRAVSTRS